MRLREFFSEDAITLGLESGTKDGVLKELVGLLKLDDKAQAMLFKMLKRRETLGSTGIGQHIAIPHCRSLVVSRLRCAFGRSVKGVDFKAIDDQPVSYVFLIVAPPLEVSNQYLPVLGKIAQFAKESDVQIYAIGEEGKLGYGRSEIQNIVGLTGGRAFCPNNFNELDYYIDLIHAELRNQYVIGYVPTNKNHDGKWRKVKIKLEPPEGLPKLILHAKEGYYAPKS